ncbi:hypothetical protein ACFL5V_00790 [Fibrobacterota bacterium]
MRLIILFMMFFGCLFNKPEPDRVQIIPRIVWMNGDQAVTPGAVDSVRITLQSPGFSSDWVKTFNYSAGKGSIKALPQGISLTIVVEGIDGQGRVVYSGSLNLEELSDENSSVEIQACLLPPPVPGHLSALAVSHDKVELKWELESDFHDLFVVERRPDSSSGFEETGRTSETSFIDSNLAPESFYQYRVCAANDGGNSAYGLYAHAVTHPYDSIPPSISIRSHANPDTVTSGTIDIFGTVNDTNGVLEFFVDSVPVDLQEQYWEKSGFALDSGLNTIVLTAVDGSEHRNAVDVELVVFYDHRPDREPPVVSVLSHSNPDTVNLKVIKLFGMVHDTSGVKQFSVGLHAVEVTGGYWEKEGFFLDSNENTIVITAVDSSGYENTGSDTLVLFYDPQYVDISNHPPYFLTVTENLEGRIKAGQTYAKVLRADDNDSSNIVYFTASPPPADDR